MKKILAVCLLIGFSCAISAGAKPKFSIRPLGNTVVKLSDFDFSRVVYRVTNNTNIRRTLNFEPINGAIQNTQLPGSCPIPFTLSKGQSCNLNLIVSNENSFRLFSQEGPVVCKTKSASDNSTDPFLCSRPSKSQTLTIKRVRKPNQPVDLFCWGLNIFSQAGINNGNMNVLEPSRVQNLPSSIRDVAEGAFHSCAVTEIGATLCWGSNASSQLGSNTPDPNSPNNTTFKPQPVSGLSSGVKGITTGFQHSCVLMDNNSVYCWGDNEFGQLGQGTTSTPSAIPKLVPFPSDIYPIKISAASNATCALMDNGQVQCWGDNSEGQIGVKPTIGNSIFASPSKIPGLNLPVVDIAAGSQHFCALLNSADVICWGFNKYDQLSTSSIYVSPPAVVNNLNDVNGVAVAITAGGNTSCALMSNNTAKCWGANNEGQLGNDNNTKSKEPTPQVVGGFATPLENIIQLKAAGANVCALQSNGQVQCWGSNTNGELGIGFAGPFTRIPTPVPNLANGVKRIFFNSNLSTMCAIKRRK